MNLFWSYDNSRIEDNLTRALIVTLRGCGDGVTASFLKCFCGTSLGVSFDFDLQSLKVTENLDLPRIRLILIITESGKPDAIVHPLLNLSERWDSAQRKKHFDRITRWLEQPHQANDRMFIDGHEIDHLTASVLKDRLLEMDGGARPDGWILSSDRRLVLLIESKLGDAYDRAQLVRHVKNHFQVNLDDVLHHASWEDIGRFFASVVRTNSIDIKTAYLSQQFCEYLDLLGFLPFQGFRHHHFQLRDQRKGFETIVETLMRDDRFNAARGANYQRGGFDYSFCLGKGRGNVGLAMWDTREVLSSKLYTGSSSMDIDALLEACERPGWKERVLQVLHRHRDLPFWRIVKIRANAFNYNYFIFMEDCVDFKEENLDECIIKLRSIHQKKWISRKNTLELARKYQDCEDLSTHPRFFISADLLFGIDIGKDELLSMDLSKTVETVGRHILALEELRLALGLGGKS